MKLKSMRLTLPQRFLLCVGLFLLPSCTPSQPEGHAVDDTAKAYFEALQSGDLEKVMTFYAEDFFKTIPREQWQERLQHLLQDQGPVQSYSLAGKQADTRYSAKFYIYQYNTQHAGKRVQHILTFIRPVDDTSKVKLVGHGIKQ